MSKKSSRFSLGQGIELGYFTIAALTAFFTQQRARHFMQELHEPARHEFQSYPKVSIILPVRNEETNIDGVLSTLTAQDYPDFEILVMDDGSTDKTPERIAEWMERDSRIRHHTIHQLPQGWAGKTNALHQGSLLATGEWLVFTDADTRHAPETLRRMVGHALHHRVDFLSMLTGMNLVGYGMRLLTPVGALLLSVQATPEEIRTKINGGAIAVGQYILLRRQLYLDSKGYDHPDMRDNFADDVGLAIHLKSQGWSLDLVDGTNLVINEQWTDFSSAWRGWRKSMFTPVRLMPAFGIIGGLFMILQAIAAPLALRRAFRADTPPWYRRLAALYSTGILAGLISGRATIDRHFKLPRHWSLHALPGWFAFGVLLLDTVRLVFGGKGEGWKGRPAPTLHQKQSVTKW